MHSRKSIYSQKKKKQQKMCKSSKASTRTMNSSIMVYNSVNNNFKTSVRVHDIVNKMSLKG